MAGASGGDLAHRVVDVVDVVFIWLACRSLQWNSLTRVGPDAFSAFPNLALLYVCGRGREGGREGRERGREGGRERDERQNIILDEIMLV